VTGALAAASRLGIRARAGLHDFAFFKRRVHQLLGAAVTFQEAYDASQGRILCVCVCPSTQVRRLKFSTHTQTQRGQNQRLELHSLPCGEIKGEPA
jgi:hypothetical protein